MNLIAKRVFITVLILGFAVSAPSSGKTANANSVLFSTSFESGMEELTGWSVVSKTHSSTFTGSDAEVYRSGSGSYKVSAAEGDSVVIASDPVKLKVGQLYRLSGWIKTEGAFSDPTARYPTALPACLSMYSFPFTNSSPAVGASKDWTKVDTLFIATKGEDRVQLHFGKNGTAEGTAWFDDVTLEKVEDISELIPLETVKWFGDGYRFDDCGWIFVHVEGEPYERGYQYGYLVADEIVAYMTKLGVQMNRGDFERGWNDMRFIADSMLLRKYDEEYLLEMKGIADGARKAGATFDGRPIDLIDIVTVNSAIDIGQMRRALGTTAHALTGRNFLRAEEEMLLKDDYNKCSSFVATGSATTDGRFVFGQIFMWGGYTGVHWDVLIDIDPAEGHRFVMHSFPGGIHSGADFYINEAGIVIGETTVSQTPYNADGTPQSNRIRKAIQYASTFEEVGEILSTRNNGMYTNDWTLANAKTDEGGVFLLGTEKTKLWRTGIEGKPADTPGNLKDFIWANNNNRSTEVRKEYLPHPENMPYDLIFRPANRDVAFQEFYKNYKDGKIDSIAAVNLWASSPINRAHACDGKITTGEMADNLVFLAHYGKTTLREKMVGERFIADLPTAEPHLTLGYSVCSPIWVTEKLKAARDAAAMQDSAMNPHRKDHCYNSVADHYAFNKAKLWQNTVFPASEAENWFVSGTSRYWRFLRYLPGSAAEARKESRDYFAENNYRYQYLIDREGDLIPVETSRAYDRYNHYDIPRIKGTTLLHQLRLKLGNETFADLMNAIHDRYREKPFSNENFAALVNEFAGEDLTGFIDQWIGRKGMPQVSVAVSGLEEAEGKWIVQLQVDQQAQPYEFITEVTFKGVSGVYHRRAEVAGASTALSYELPEKPHSLEFNSSFDVPVKQDNCFVYGHLTEEFHKLTIVHGTSRQLEANHTIAKDWCYNLAEAYLEILVPVVKDCEITEEELKTRDLIVMGAPSENTLMKRLADEKLIPVEFATNCFTWNGMTFDDRDDGLILVMPNPWNEERILYLFVANSQLQMHKMTSRYRRGLNEWSLFKGGRVIGSGFNNAAAMKTDITE